MPSTVFPRRLQTTLYLALFLFAALPAAAFDTFFAGPRAMGMGGANVASVADTTGQYYNPAVFGFFGCRTVDGGRLACDNNNVGRKGWGSDLNAAAGVRLHNEFGNYLDDLADIERMDLSDGVDSQSELEQLIRLVKNLDGLDDPGNAITADATAGWGVRVGHFGIGVRGYLQANGRVLDIDDQNLGLDVDSATLQTEINAVTMAPGYSSAGYVPQVFSPTQVEDLRRAFGDATLSDPASLEAVQRLDFIALQEGFTTDGSSELLTSLIAQSGSGNRLEENTTTVLLQGFGLAEIPISYGYALNDHWAVGANLKVMRGRVYGNRVLVFEEDSGDVIKETDEHFEETTTFGVDVGVMGRYRFFNVGLIGRNLNAPKFDGFTDTIQVTDGSTELIEVEDVTIDPQVTAGVAFIPFETLTLEIDYDLTKNETAFPGYDTRNLSFGLEWDAFRVLALRTGAFRNLAEDDIDWVYTAGLGLNLWAVRLDVAGAFAGGKEEYDGDEVPRETRVAAQLSVDF